MGRIGIGLGSLAALVAVALTPGAAPAAANRKLVEGTVYDATCATACTPGCPPPPHCGPITARSPSRLVCAQTQKRIVACPLRQAGGAEGPVYSGEGAVVNVRRRGSATVLARLPVVAGHFKRRLGPGEYVLHPYLPEEPCWSGEPATVVVTPRLHSPVPVTLDVGDGCVAHPGAG